MSKFYAIVISAMISAYLIISSAAFVHSLPLVK